MSLLDKIDKRRMVAFKNELLSSPYKKHPDLLLSVAQTKVILYLVSLIDKDDTEFKTVKISFKDFCENFNFSYEGGKSRREIKKQIYGLMDKKLVLPGEDGTKTHYHWLGPVTEYENEEAIGFILSEYLRPYYLELKDNFTQYQLGYVADFKNKYSFLVYDTLQRWSTYNNGEFFWQISKAQADLCAGKYENTRDFIRYVIKPAIAEINEKSDLYVVQSVVKENRKNKVLCFTIRKKSKESLEKIKDNWIKTDSINSAIDEAFEKNEEQLILDGFHEYEEVEI